MPQPSRPTATPPHSDNSHSLSHSFITTCAYPLFTSPDLAHYPLTMWLFLQLFCKHSSLAVMHTQSYTLNG